MGASLAILHFVILTVLLFLSKLSHSMNTIILDGLADWKSPTLDVGDSPVFKHKNLRNLYLFRNRKVLDLCLFAQCRPTRRPGFNYFSLKDKSKKSSEKGEKVSVKVITPEPSLGFPPLSAPAPTSGGDFPSFPSPSRVSGSPSSPSPAPKDSALHPGSQPPSEAPASGSSDSEGIPFISSNPAVSIPTGETDTATIRPLPTPGDGSQEVGLGSSLRVGMALLALVMVSHAFHLWL